MYQIKNNKYNNKFENVGEITIYGYSKSAYRTGYIVMPYGIYLDAGLQSSIQPNLILVSHGHYDHIASLYGLLLENKDCPIVVNSIIIGEQVRNMLYSTKLLNKGTLYDKEQENIVLLEGEQIYEYSKDIVIKSYPLDHTVMCSGYGIMLIKKKLKDEYIGLSGKEIVELKKTTEITKNVTIGLVLYISDTGKSILSSLPFNQYKIVVIECTFYEDEDYTEAETKKHLHWYDIKPYVEFYKNTQFIFGHFSMKYSENKLSEFKEQLKEYNNITIFT